MRIACDERLSTERILPPSSDFIKIRESHFTVQSFYSSVYYLKNYFPAVTLTKQGS